MMRRRYSTVPDVPRGYVLNPERGWFSVIVPEATINRVKNPSVETNLTGYTGINGASIARTTAYQTRGAYSVVVTPTSTVNSGVAHDLGTNTAGVTSTQSVDVIGAPGVPYLLAFADTSNNIIGSKKSFVGTGRVQRIHVSYTETTTVARRLIVTKDGSASTAAFYVDAWQCEDKPYQTTYCDGDQQGLVAQTPPAFLWTGLPHGSTSTRSAQTAAGGRVVNLDQYGFKVLGYVGGGSPEPTTVTTPNGLFDGAQYQRTIYEGRDISISGYFETTTFDDLQRKRRALRVVLGRDFVAVDQPRVLRYHAYDRLRPLGPSLDFTVSYAGGLEETTDNLVQERPTIRFEQKTQIGGTSGEAGATLAVSQTITNIQSIAQRTPQGQWRSIGNVDGNVYAIVQAQNGDVYIGGVFTSAGGVSANNIAKYDGASWSALGSGANGEIRTLAFGPDGTLYAGGDFTTIGGVSANRVAKYDGASWSALGSGANGALLTLVVTATGTLYAGGIFTTIGGVSANRVAKYDGASWSALGSGADNTVATLALSPNGTLYAGGAFITIGGVTTYYIAKYDGASWSALGSGANGAVQVIGFGPDGTLYAGGSYTTIGGIAANRMGKWNGAAWSALGIGLGSGGVNALATTRDGLVYVSGTFTSAGGTATPDALAAWNGGGWIANDIDMPPIGGRSLYAILAQPDGSLIVGGSSAGFSTGTAAGLTTIVNGGTARTFPKLKFVGPTSGTARIYQFLNTTTNRGVYFGLLIAAGETISINLDPLNLSFVSSFVSNVRNTVLSSSTPSEMFLQPGANTISFFASDATVTATLWWPVRYLGMDDATL